MTTSDPEKIRRRLQELEEEKRRLEAEMRRAAQDLSVVEIEKDGRPMLEFRRGTAKPFRLGIKKLEAVREGLDQVHSFLSKHNGDQPAHGEVQI